MVAAGYGRHVDPKGGGMSFLSPDKPAEEDLADQQEQKEAEVLEREGVEQDLMQSGESELGEQIDNVEEKGE